jgi:hypothetical protein
MTSTNTGMTGDQWLTANSRYLESEMARLRQLLHRRILWQRTQWRRDGPNGYPGWAISEQEADALLEQQNSEQESAFYASDSKAREVSAALEETSLRVASLRRELEDAGTSAAIDRLATCFALTEFERDVLLLCVAPELDRSFERLYAYLHDDATKKFVTPWLTHALLAAGEPVELVRANFLPGGSLRRWRLLTVDEVASAAGLSGAVLRLDEAMASYILGSGGLDDRCQRVTRTTSHTLLPSCHRDVVSQLAHWLSTNTGDVKVINLVGPPDSGKLAVARAVCNLLGLQLRVIDLPALPTAEMDRRELMALLDRDAALLGMLLYFDIESWKPEDRQPFRLNEDVVAPVVIASGEPFRCEGDMLSVQIARPDSRSQLEMWTESLGDSSTLLNGQVAAIAEQFDFGPRSIERTVALAEAFASLRSPGETTIRGEDLWQACRRQGGPQLEQLAQKIQPCYDWDDIVVPVEVSLQLREITAQVAHRHAVYQGWGFGKKLSRGRGISVLFSGPSGVGKTMAAEVMAQHLNLDLYRIDLAGVVSKYIGQTEKNLRNVFDAAERSGAILFFDEADALFGKRSEVKDSHDRYANIEVNYLLQRMEDYRGLAILATNMKSFLDTAFLRRLRFIVEFPFPDAALRMEIWRRVFPPTAETGTLDFVALSRMEIAGGNIRNIALNAAFLAVEEGVPIGMGHVMNAARREYTKIERLIMDAEFGPFAQARTR